MNSRAFRRSGVWKPSVNRPAAPDERTRFLRSTLAPPEAGAAHCRLQLRELGVLLHGDLEGAVESTGV